MAIWIKKKYNSNSFLHFTEPEKLEKNDKSSALNTGGGGGGYSYL